MIQDRLDKIEERLKQGAIHVKESEQANYDLLTTLRTEIAAFPRLTMSRRKARRVCRIISPRSYTQRKESGALQFVD